jgi:hypothetical protein
MGTRSLTFVYDGSNSDDGTNEPIMCIYRQFDGYPSGHGHELAQFLNSKTLVNGYSDKNSAQANGMGCLAAQLIVQLKHGVGGIYIYAPMTGRDYSQDYEYHVYEDKVIVYHDFPYGESPYDQEPLFEGTWEEFGQFCLDPISAE